MARITVEDCLQKIPNRFQLVLAATYRARMLSQGHAQSISGTFGEIECNEYGLYRHVRCFNDRLKITSPPLITK